MDRHGRTAARTETLDPIERTIDQLIRQRIEDDVRSRGTGDADEIILDIEISGIRYLTIRCGSRLQHLERCDGEAQTGESPGPPAPLSPRELEIARMVAKGYANKSIASVLDISSWTVSSHLRRIYTKLGVTSRAAMVARLLDAHSDGAVSL